MASSESSPTTSSSPTSSNSSCHCTYSKGTTAGIGVGSAFAGALVALFLGFIWINTRRRSSEHRKSRNPSSRHSFPIHAANPTTSTLPAALDRLEDALPQALTHTDLEREASQIETAIRNYLDNYIDWNGLPKSPPLDDGRLSDLAGGLRIDWKQKLNSRGSRSTTLRIFVARFLAARVDVIGASGSTTLPPEIMRTYQIIKKDQNKNRESWCHYLGAVVVLLCEGTGNIDTRLHCAPGNGPALEHTWRAMTSYLVSNTYPSDRPALTPTHLLYEAVNREATNLREVLAPLRHRRDGTEERETDVLRELVAKAALLGLHMFSQRNVTELFWRKKVEVFPGVRQTSVMPEAINGASWLIIREPQL